MSALQLVLRDRSVLRYRAALNIRGGIESLLHLSSRALLPYGWNPTIISEHAPEEYRDHSSVPTVEVRRRMTALGMVSPELIYRAARLRPSVVEVHGLNRRSALAHLCGPWIRLAYPYLHPDVLASPRAAAVRKNALAALKWANALVFMTAEEHVVFEELTGKPVKAAAVISPGADPVFGPNDYHVDGRDISLVIARLERSKQVDVVVEAAANAGTLRNLRVVGDGSDRERLEKLVESHGVDARNVLLGRLSDEAVGNLFAQSARLITMSISESYGMTVQEGIAYGVPIVASDIPSHREILSRIPSDYYRLVQPGDTTELTRVMQEKLLYPPLGRYSRSWDQVARELISLYESVRS